MAMPLGKWENGNDAGKSWNLGLSEKYGGNVQQRHGENR
jgi:hypothetical protein